MRRSNAPVFWLMFGAGGMLSALFGSALVFITAAGEPSQIVAAGDEAAAFRRTASRLEEMRSADYLNEWFEFDPLKATQSAFIKARDSARRDRFFSGQRGMLSAIMPTIGSLPLPAS